LILLILEVAGETPTFPPLELCFVNVMDGAENIRSVVRTTRKQTPRRWVR